MRALSIVGSRNMTNYEEFCKNVQDTLDKWDIIPDKIVSGGAKGADSLAERWAKERNIEMITFKPDWNKYGRAAGIIRNGDIINAATHCIAFPSHSGAGTQNSIKRAKEKGIPCEVF